MSIKKLNKKTKKILLFLLKSGVSLGFVTWIVLQTDWAQVLLYVGKIKIWHIGLYLLFLILGMVVSAKKWQELAAYKGIKLPLKDFFKFYLTGTFINNFMPSFIGGDTFRAYEIGKPEKKYVEAVSTVMIDRITGFVGATILVVLFAFINIRTILKSDVLMLVVLLVLLSLFVDIIIAKTKKMPFWERVYKFLPEKIANLMRELDHYNNNSGVLSRAIWLAMVFAVLGVAAANYVLFWSLGVKISVLDYLSVIFLISIISAVPVSINNIGIKEWAYVTFFGFFGVNSAVVIAIAIISRFLQMLFSFLALPIYMKARIDKDLATAVPEEV